MNIEEIKSEVVGLVKNRDHVSFVEIRNHFRGKIPVKGDTAVIMREDPNLILWPNLNAQLANAIVELLAEKAIFPHPTSMITYLVDGAIPNLPLANRPPPGGYKKPRWLPVCFSAAPMKKITARLRRNRRSLVR